MPAINDIELGSNFGSYCDVYIDFKRHGLDCFEEDGFYGGYDGGAIIEAVLRRFECLEMYKHCAFLRDFLILYRKKFAAQLITDIEAAQAG